MSACGPAGGTCTDCGTRADGCAAGVCKCGAGALCAAGVACVAGVCQVPETNCYDGVDNDGDGKIDCVDPDCSHKQCTAVANSRSVCCGAGPNATNCKNLGTDAANCGACGITCASGSCQTADEGGRYTGKCTCPSGTAQCPSIGDGQVCNTGLCSCNDNDNACGSGGICGVTLCHY